MRDRPHRDRPPSRLRATGAVGDRRGGARVRAALGSVAAGSLGLAPHVLHHVGLLAGAALLAGTAGAALFGALGFLATIPMLLGLRRRTGSWRAPGAALALFATAFVVSTTLIGPALTGNAQDSPEGSRPDGGPSEVRPSLPPGHDRHHP